MCIFYIDGHYLPEAQALLPVQDLSILRGYGVFDFTRTYGGRPFHLQEHIERLARSARLIEMPLPCSCEKIGQITMDTLARNALAEANIRLVVTGGVSSDNLLPDGPSRLLVMVTPVMPNPSEWYTAGAAAITCHDQRYLPGAKTIHYIPAILALSRARRQDAVEAIYTNSHGHLLEGTTSNFFAFIGNTLVTPGASILAGITRQVVLSLVQTEFKVQIRDIHRQEMPLIDEAFITASNKQVVPLVRLDHLTVGQAGKVGERTRRVMALFDAYTRAYGASCPP